METHPAIKPVGFIVYKFLNSIFLGLSVGAVFVLYTPLSPSIFSAGGIGLALGTVLVTTQYRRILVPKWFYRLSLLVEFTTLTGVAAVLVLPLDLTLALFIYIGYQITFALGGYLVRCETLLMVSIDQLRKLDMAKQVGYLLGMAVAWAAYTGLAAFAGIQDRAAQVIALHWPLLVIEAAVIAALLLAFNREELRSASAPLAL
jgi:putative membrane protein